MLQEKEHNRLEQQKLKKNLRNRKGGLVDRVEDIIEDKNSRLVKIKRQLRKEMKIKEMKECTFAPKINNTSKTHKRSVSDLFEWKIQQDMKISKIAKQLDKEHFQGKPIISQKSRDIVKTLPIDDEIRDLSVEDRLLYQEKIKQSRIAQMKKLQEKSEQEKVEKIKKRRLRKARQHTANIQLHSVRKPSVRNIMKRIEDEEVMEKSQTLKNLILTSNQELSKISSNSSQDPDSASVSPTPSSHYCSRSHSIIEKAESLKKKRVRDLFSKATKLTKNNPPSPSSKKSSPVPRLRPPLNLSPRPSKIQLRDSTAEFAECSNRLLSLMFEEVPSNISKTIKPLKKKPVPPKAEHLKCRYNYPDSESSVANMSESSISHATSKYEKTKHRISEPEMGALELVGKLQNIDDSLEVPTLAKKNVFVDLSFGGEGVFRNDTIVKTLR